MLYDFIDKALNTLHYHIYKDQYLDNYINNIISSKTGFKADEIILLRASKSNIKVFNEFDTFLFKYKGLIYNLDKNNQLLISKDQEQ